ncbi:MAG: tetratricopeptide repeat protein, partial [Bacteroidota bacterium]
YKATGEYVKSIQYYEECLGMEKELYGDTHADVAITLSDLGNVHNVLGEHKKSIVYYEEALQIRRQAHDGPHPSVASTLYSLGNLHKATGEYVKSIQCYEECLGIEKRSYGDTHADVAITLADLGNVHSVLGEREKSIEYYEEALQIRGQIHDGPHPDVAFILYILAIAYYSSEQPQKSTTYYEEALSVYQQLSENDPENTYASTRASIAHNLACMYHVEALSAMQKDQDQTAQEYLTKAKDTFELAIAANNPPTASLCTEYANFLLATEQIEQACQYLEQTIATGDNEDELGYNMLERETVTPALRDKISQDNPVSLRAMDYAYYLLIHHYEDFQTVGINLDKPREAYLADFQEAVKKRSGQEGKEQEDEIARYLLKSLEQE